MWVTECLIKDRETLLAFYDFPAEHWKHLRKTNRARSRQCIIIESCVVSMAINSCRKSSTM